MKNIWTLSNDRSQEPLSQATPQGSPAQVPTPSHPLCTILFMGDQWDIQWRRRQQLAWRLAAWEGCRRLVYVETPLTWASLRHLFLNRPGDARDRWSRVGRQRGFRFRPAPKLEVFTPLGLLPGLGPRSARVQDALAWPLLRRVARSLRRETGASECLLLWISLPHTPPALFKEAQADVVWYDVTEDFSAISILPPQVRRILQEQDGFWTQAADIVSTVSTEMYGLKAPESRRAINLPNAVDSNPFQSPQAHPPPPEMESLPRPRILFIGGAAYRQDWDLVRYLASQRPHWSFVFVGNLDERPDLRAYPALRFLGFKPYSELPAYLHNSDACIQLYAPGHYTDSGSSLKLLLYLAAGRPAISTPFADAPELEGAVEIAHDHIQFLELLERELAEDSPEKQHARRALAARHSWDGRVAQITSLLQELALSVPPTQAQGPTRP